MDGQDVFKKEFKYYKANKSPPILDNVINIYNGTKKFDKVIRNSSLCLQENDRTDILGLIPITKWQIYEFESNPGLVYIRNPFTSLGQRFWMRKSLESYTRKPNRTNIDYEMVIGDWWRECYQNGAPDEVLQKKMRWVTMGYHHNWDTKVYNEANKDKFPEELAELCDVVAVTLGYKSFRPEAAIINYYHMGSTLSAHTDHSEMNLEAPLFSFSFGQSAIFLIGGTSKAVKPTAVMLHSGDIVMMSKQARLCYHAVPRILSVSEMPWSQYEMFSELKQCAFKYIDDFDRFKEAVYENLDFNLWSRFNNYVSKSRININVRQVLNNENNCL